MRSSSPLLCWTWLAFVFFAFAPSTNAVKRGDFKTCAQSGFCRRLRDLPTSATSSPYSIKPESASFDKSSGLFTAEITSAIWPEAHFGLSIGITARDGLARLRVDEIGGLRQRYNETSRWALLAEPSFATDVEYSKKGSQGTLSWTHASHTQQARFSFSPLKIEFIRDGDTHIIFNEENLFHMEHFRVKKVGTDAQDPPDVEIDEQVKQSRQAFEPFMSEDGAWEETFNGHPDSKPKGPESYSFDVTFPGYEHVFGIPEHASPLSLRTTRGGDGAFTDPYRLWNLDVFEYEADSEMALYGAIPFMHAHRPGSTVALFSLTGSENWIDITKSGKATHTHWMAESGIIDLLIFLGPTNGEVFESYGQLTGMTALPQMFAIGHHQCRWNYLNQQDVKEVSERFDEYDIPMDVLWLDIEYAEDHKYFIWEKANFPEPEKMQDDLAAVGRQLVAIVDPHIKRTSDLYVYKEAQDLDILYKKADGKTEFEGWCWTGSSSWVDYFNPTAMSWWIGLFKFDKFKGSKRNLFIWNDMNEPSVFNGPEITAHKDVIHHGGWEHRDIHNINGMVYHNLTSQALIAREDPPRRPFVLSRSFFAGSQRFGAIWTGDNMGTWEHLAGAVPMVLSNNIAGMTFSGADVGGFFGNPSEEMLVRWYQSGAFHPFFRAHAHIDTKRREPYLFDEPIRSYLRDAIRLRYSLLPAWYTGFFHASLSGSPIAKPHYVVFPDDAAGFAEDKQFFVSNSGLLVKPVVEEGATTASVYLADDQPYYNYFDRSIYTRASSSSSRSHITVPAELSQLPLFHHGGSILTRRDTVRRAAPLMWKDPITLVIALDKAGTRASGDIYLDDGDSYNFEKGELVWRGFELSSGEGKTLKLESIDLVKAYRGANEQFAKMAASYDLQNAYAKSIATVTVGEIQILGLSKAPTCVSVPGSASGLDYEFVEGAASNAGSKKNGQAASLLKIFNAELPITKDWTLSIDFDIGKACQTRPAARDSASVEDPTCPKAGMKRCQNKGHISACVLLSRVNDGICDPECCDGSDETDGKVNCPDRCAAVNKEFRAKADEESRIQRVGAKIRKDWSTAGLKEKRKIERSIEKIRTEIVGLQDKEASLKAVLDKVERSEAGEIEKKKNSKLFKRMEEYQSTVTSLRKHREYLHDQVSSLQNLLEDLKKSFNPNYQDMAVLGAVRAFDDWRRKNGYAVTEDMPEESEGAEDSQPKPKEDVVPVEVDFDDLSEDQLKSFESEDILGLMAELDAGPGQETANLLFRIEEYLPDSLRSRYDSFRKTLLDTLTNFGIISKQAIEQADRPDVARARSAHQSAENDLRDGQNKLKKEEEALAKDWGQGWEWKKLDGQCVDKDSGEYTYQICWFKKVTQKSNKGHGTTTLGNFASWRDDTPAGSPESYTKQIYDKGQRCWNGPDRSALVDLVCGTSNAILSVSEPEKCTYLFKVQTPAVCAEPTSDTPGSSAQKDEL